MEFQTTFFINAAKANGLEYRSGEYSLGSIRQGYIKNSARILIQDYPDEFTADFETNKRLVEQYTDGTAKAVRNRLAGYLVRLVRMEQAKEERAAAEPEEPVDMEL